MFLEQQGNKLDFGLFIFFLGDIDKKIVISCLVTQGLCNRQNLKKHGGQCLNSWLSIMHISSPVVEFLLLLESSINCAHFASLEVTNNMVIIMRFQNNCHYEISEIMIY